MSLPDGVERRTFDGTERLATRGPPLGDEPTDGDWRAWDPHRSKLGAMLERGMDVPMPPDASVCYLGAASGTTASHVADACGPTYAVEFAPRPMRSLCEAAADRPRLFPLLKDARKPATYAHVVETHCDLLVQDVATRGQARVARLNRPFLAEDGRLAMAVKARSEDVTADPESVFEDVQAELSDEYEVLATERLDPYHRDHLAVLARPR